VFGVINAFIVPVVYFFYVSLLLPVPDSFPPKKVNIHHTSQSQLTPSATQPETSGRSLEEMDDIFRAVHGFKGAFTVVKVAHEMPRRYGKKGELLINYDDTEGARRMSERRRSSIAAQEAGGAKKKYSGSPDGSGEKVEDVDVESGNGFR
jgi:hypothetical protein